MFSDKIEKVLHNPDALSKLQNVAHFGALSNYEQQPANVRARVRALKNIHLKTLDIEKKYFQEVHALECKYEKLFEPLMKKRADIVKGTYEPKGAETEFKEELENVNEKSDPSIKGIPEFWLTVFKNVDKIAATITEADEPILKHLIDVRLILKDNPMGFEIEFEFEPNNYFSNQILKKYYVLANEINPESPFEYEGPEVVDCKGTQINWKSDDLNPTKRVSDKTKKNKNKGTVIRCQEVVDADSFFNFFSPPQIPSSKNEEDYDDELRMEIEEDFEIGEVLRQAVLHEAVLCYTGEALIDDEDDYDIIDEMEDEEDSDDESEDGHRNRRNKGF